MINNDFNDLALFKFHVIAPVINNTHGFSSNEEYFKHASNKSYSFNNKDLKFSKSCIKSWYLSYKKNGFQSLQKKTRKDFRMPRKLNNDTIRRIISLREEFPSITGCSIYKKLIDEKYINKLDVSLDTVLRFIKLNNLKASQVSNIDRRMFEMENVNDCWQSDTSFGPYITIDNKKYRTKLIMFIDDKSRLIMGFDFFLNDNAINMQEVFKKAIKTYGKPKRLFVDNGGPYDNKQLSLICATLGIELIHAKPYSPESKAKIERSFRTIKDGWMRCTDWNEFTSLEQIKTSLQTFLYNNYTNKVHSSTKETPNERWHNEYNKVVFLDEKFVDESFLHRIERKVRNDRTIKLDNFFYEVPFKYVHQTICLRYDPLNLDTLYIYEDNKCICEVHKVDKVSNSKIKRKNNIDYSKVINDERDVIEDV